MRRLLARRCLWSALGGMAVSAASVAHAQPAGDVATPPPLSPGDYALDHGDWNGMRDFTLLAHSERVELVPHTTLDLDTLNIEEPLLIVYPMQPLRADALARFIVRGGQIILADDFGASTSLLQRLDIDRQTPSPGALPHNDYLAQNLATPILRARGVHRLLDEVEVVVANHPAVLQNIGGPVLAYSESGGLVYDMRLGEGKVIVIGDASLIINHMLGVADNAQLWRNTLRYTCQTRDPCRVHLYVGNFEQAGSYGADESGLLGDREAIEDRISSLNRTVRELMEQLPASQLFYYLSILLAVGLVVYLLVIFPLRRTRPYSTYISDTLRAVHAPQSEFDWNLTRFSQGNASMNYALPASILKEIFEEMFLRAMDLWELEARPEITEIASDFAERYLKNYPAAERDAIARRLTALLATLTTVPTRHRVFLDSDSYVSERDLLRIHEQALDILDIMQLKESYERRTRSHG